VRGEKERDKLRQLAKQNFAALIDYWAVDWDYDGVTFKSQWQDFRGNGRRTKPIRTVASEELSLNRPRIIAVRVVDIFGNDAAATVRVSSEG